jgi:hypothetical protein
MTGHKTLNTPALYAPQRDRSPGSSGSPRGSYGIEAVAAGDSLTGSTRENLFCEGLSVCRPSEQVMFRKRQVLVPAT